MRNPAWREGNFSQLLICLIFPHFIYVFQSERTSSRESRARAQCPVKWVRWHLLSFPSARAYNIPQGKHTLSSCQITAPPLSEPWSFSWFGSFFRTNGLQKTTETLEHLWAPLQLSPGPQVKEVEGKTQSVSKYSPQCGSSPHWTPKSRFLSRWPLIQKVQTHLLRQQESEQVPQGGKLQLRNSPIQQWNVRWWAPCPWRHSNNTESYQRRCPTQPALEDSE